MDGPWTQEEIEDYERWLREFGKPSDDPEHDELLDWAEAELGWNKPVPSC